MLPGHWGYFPQQRDRLLVAGSRIPLQQGGEHDRVVGDDGLRSAGRIDGDIEIGSPDQLLLAADLRDVGAGGGGWNFPYNELFRESKSRRSQVLLGLGNRRVTMPNAVFGKVDG